MDELVELVSQKTGLSQELAKTAVDTVIGFLKQKLPAPMASQIDSLISSVAPAAGAGDASGLGGMAQGLGSLLGKR
jgi:nucleoid DNA-binding protein